MSIKIWPGVECAGNAWNRRSHTFLHWIKPSHCGILCLLCRSAAPNEGQLTLMFEHHLVRLTIKGGLQSSENDTSCYRFQCVLFSC